MICIYIAIINLWADESDIFFGTFVESIDILNSTASSSIYSTIFFAVDFTFIFTNDCIIACVESMKCAFLVVEFYL